jgi:hypothetical protein
MLPIEGASAKQCNSDNNGKACRHDHQNLTIIMMMIPVRLRKTKHLLGYHSLKNTVYIWLLHWKTNVYWS